jgi:lipopolysaccharide/colanic/teichoic acid biosynthesis glycosyltransferase
MCAGAYIKGGEHMPKIRIHSSWRPTFFGAQDKKGRFELYSPALTQKILQYERSRADRQESCFSGVLFKLYGSEAQMMYFACLLKNGVRLTDHLGWYETDTICVILAATDIAGARLFADKIGTLYATVQRNFENGRRFSYTHEIFGYPETDENTKDEESINESAVYRENTLRFGEVLEKYFGLEIPLWKRGLDIFGSLFGILLLLPIFLSVALYIKLVSKGPVFYTQERVGFKGKSFTFFKFRTMHYHNDESFHTNHALDFITRSDVPMEKLDDHDPRIIPGGRILRRTCIDELPQLFNVLRGDMSLVGPRPCIPYEAEKYLRWHAQRFDVMPGCTGLWQVSGKNKLSFHTMVSLDIAYMRKMSLWFDLKLILLTFPAVIGMVWESIMRRLQKLQKPDYTTTSQQ